MPKKSARSKPRPAKSTRKPFDDQVLRMKGEICLKIIQALLGLRTDESTRIHINKEDLDVVYEPHERLCFGRIGNEHGAVRMHRHLTKLTDSIWSAYDSCCILNAIAASDLELETALLAMRKVLAQAHQLSSENLVVSVKHSQLWHPTNGWRAYVSGKSSSADGFATKHMALVDAFKIEFEELSKIVKRIEAITSDALPLIETRQPAPTAVSF